MSALAVFLVAVGLADISRKVTAYHWLPTAMGTGGSDRGSCAGWSMASR